MFESLTWNELIHPMLLDGIGYMILWMLLILGCIGLVALVQRLDQQDGQ